MLDMQGRWKLLKGGMAIGTNVRVHGAADFLEVVKQLRNCKVQKNISIFYFFEWSGRALVATCHNNNIFRRQQLTCTKRISSSRVTFIWRQAPMWDRQSGSCPSHIWNWLFQKSFHYWRGSSYDSGILDFGWELLIELTSWWICRNLCSHSLWSGLHCVLWWFMRSITLSDLVCNGLLGITVIW